MSDESSEKLKVMWAQDWEIVVCERQDWLVSKGKETKKERERENPGHEEKESKCW